MKIARMLSVCPAIVCLAVVAAPSRAATVLLNDTFDVPSGAATRFDDAADPLDADWWRADQENTTVPVLTVAADGAFFGSTEVLNVNPGGVGMRPFIGGFATTTLASVGDKLALSVKYRQPADQGGGLRMGLFNNGGTATAADNNTSSNNDIGYLLNLGTPTTGNGSTALSKDSAGTGEIMTSAVSIGTTLASGILPDNIVHSVTFTIERTAAGQLTITASWTGDTNGSTISATDASGLITTFNEVAFAWGGAGATNYLLDDIRVEFTAAPTLVPEPASLGLLAAIAPALLRCRRRRR